MTYDQLTECCLAETIGEGGLSAASLAQLSAAAGPVVARLAAADADGSLAFLAAPRRSDDLAACGEVSRSFRDHCSEVLVLGTGGSSLGGRSLAALADRGFGPAAGGPRLRFLDTVDPDTVAVLLDRLDFAATGVLAISKSGGTAETLAQLLVLLPRLERALGREGLAQRLAVITEPGGGALGALAEAYGCTRLAHDPDLGGRFSVFSAVGALPAMIAGLDPAAFRAGGRAVLEASLDAAAPADSPPAVGAAIAVGLAQERRLAQNVLMTYVDRLAPFGLWHRQLWAESLGKDGLGLTPIDARGAADQHSQLQLYLAGPADKLFTLVRLETAGLGPRIEPERAVGAGVGYLGGRSLGDLLGAMARATADTLARTGRPVRQFVLRELGEYQLGALMMHFMLETVIAADLLGVNPFDQPAVEEGKRLARDYLRTAARGGETAS
jgi:glucose-6-phosphate isomerase